MSPVFPAMNKPERVPGGAGSLSGQAFRNALSYLLPVQLPGMGEALPTAEGTGEFKGDGDAVP